MSPLPLPERRPRILAGRTDEAVCEPGWLIEHGSYTAFAKASEWRRFADLEGPDELLLKHLSSSARFTFNLRAGAQVTEVTETDGQLVARPLPTRTWAWT